MDEPYVGSYTVDGRTILSESEVGGNIVYRVDGVLASPRQLAQFEMVPSVIPAADTMTTETITKKTYRTPAMRSESPGGASLPEAADRPGASTETTTTVIDDGSN